MPIILANNISKAYAIKPVIFKLSLHLSKCGVVGLLGANGTGKTTLIKMLSGVLKSDSGDIIINGFSINSQRISAQRQFGYLPESTLGYNYLTVYDFLEFAAQIRHLPKKRVKEAVNRCLNQMDLKSVSDQKLCQLSKGMRQRAWLAQSLIHEPNILFLDEPTDGLDPIQKQRTRKIIREVSKSKIILMSTHILEEAELLCDHLIIMRKGQIIRRGEKVEFEDKQGRIENHILPLIG